MDRSSFVRIENISNGIGWACRTMNISFMIHCNQYIRIMFYCVLRLILPYSILYYFLSSPNRNEVSFPESLSNPTVVRVFGELCFFNWISLSEQNARRPRDGLFYCLLWWMKIVVTLKSDSSISLSLEYIFRAIKILGEKYARSFVHSKILFLVGNLNERNMLFSSFGIKPYRIELRRFGSGMKSIPFLNYYTSILYTIYIYTVQCDVWDHSVWIILYY